MTAEMELFSHELLRDLGGLGAITGVVARDHLEWMTVDSAGLVDLLRRQLHALQVLESVTLLPGSDCSDDVRFLASSAGTQRQKRE